MATVTYGTGFSELYISQGLLLNAFGGATINTKNATTFIFTYPAGNVFEGYSVTVKGSGFIYDGDEPIAGTMSGITIKDDSGAKILTITGLAAGTPASDLNLFYANTFGWTDPNGNYNKPPTDLVWSQILSGSDTFSGTSGNDWSGMPGVNAGNDVFNMGDGDDWVFGSMGNDTINGGNGWDTLSFENTQWDSGIPMVRGINANLNTGVVLDPYGFTDTVTGVEHIVGSSYADVMTGDGFENEFEGGRGKDTMNGGGGDQDWVSYQNEQWWGGSHGIVANLTAGTIRDGFGNVDTVKNIENVTGTRYDDSFVGDAGRNTFIGGNGKDSFDGKGGDDSIRFSLNWANAPQHGISVNLSKASNQIIDDGFGNTETATSISGISGGSFKDKIKGDAGANVLSGLDGRDTLTGGGGNDHFEWWDPNHMDDRDVITDFKSAAGANQDVLVFYMSAFGASTTLTLVNGTAATAAVSTFIFDAATDTLYWDEDGTGAGARIAVAVLQGVNSLSAENFDLF
jgi:serralysin